MILSNHSHLLRTILVLSCKCTFVSANKKCMYCCRGSLVDGNGRHTVTKAQSADITGSTWAISGLDEPESYTKTKERCRSDTSQGKS